MKRFEEIEARLNAATPGPWLQRFKEEINSDNPSGWPQIVKVPVITSGYGKGAPVVDFEAENNLPLALHAPTDLRYLLDFAKAAKEALEKIDKFEPAFHHTSAEQQDEMRACRDCAAAMERKWPPSGLCDSHYSLLASFEQRNKNERSYQHAHMRSFAREALALLEGGSK